MHIKLLILYKSFSYMVTVSIVLFMLVDVVLANDLRFEACVPATCGQVNISYPFWISDRQESYCGHPSYEISCRDKLPILAISGDDYIIENVFYNNNSIHLANTRLYDSKITCPIPLRNFSLSNTPFDENPSYTDLFFLYNCSSYPSDPTYKIGCGNNSTHVSFAVFHLEILEHENYSISSCQSWVKAPVDGENIDALLELDFTGVLRKGFILEWNEANCTSCNRTGGRCGFENNEFICFCSDKPHSRSCNDGKKTHVGTYIAKGFAGLAGLFLIAAVVFIVFRCRNKKGNPISSLWESRNISSYGSSLLDLEKSEVYFISRIM